jgi:hypothetical protein
MSIWVRALCRKSVASVTPAKLKTGIVKRLELLMYMFDDAEDPEQVMKSLRVENASRGKGFSVCLIHYRPHDEHFIRAERWSGKEAVNEVTELKESLEGQRSQAVKRINALLGGVKETVAFELKLSDAQGTGWPVSLAAAAWLSEIGDGLIQADESGWYAPTDLEVECILED